MIPLLLLKSSLHHRQCPMEILMMTKHTQSSLERHSDPAAQSRHLPQGSPTAAMCLSINYTEVSRQPHLFIGKCWLFLQVCHLAYDFSFAQFINCSFLQLFRKSSNRKEAKKLTRNTLQCWWRRWKWPRLAKIHLALHLHFWVWSSNEFPPVSSKSSSQRQPNVYSTCWAVTLKVTTASWFGRWSAVLVFYFETRMFQPGPLLPPCRFTTHYWHLCPAPSHRFAKLHNTPFGNLK